MSGDNKKIRTSLSVLESIADEISRDESLRPHLRIDWKTNPAVLPPRGNHISGGVRTKHVVGIDDLPDKICDLFKNRDEREGRPAMGMLNAGSGSGKSVALEFSEQQINQSLPRQYTAMAITFNIHFPHDLDTLDECEGLTMRIAERFFMRSVGDSFNAFREMWVNHLREKTPVNLFNVVDGILQLLAKTGGDEPKLLILVDEPGLAGSTSLRKTRPGVAARGGTMNECARNVVNSTSVLRLRGSEKSGVRFLFTTLQPVYDNDELNCVTKTGGPIRWLDLPFFRPDNTMRSLLKDELESIQELMPQDDFNRSIDFIITMSSGHWTTFNAITDAVKEITGILGTTANKWMSTIYFENVRDVVVQTKDTSSKSMKASDYLHFQELVSMALLGVFIPPFKEMFADAEYKSLSQLSYARLVQNRFGAEQGVSVLDSEIPHLSLLEVREWALDTAFDDSELKQAVTGLLSSAGHDPTRNPREHRLPPGIGFERVMTHFFHSKMLAWVEFLKTHPTLTSLGIVSGTKFAKFKCNGFFSGCEVLYPAPPSKILFKMSAPSASFLPRLLNINSSGGFRMKKFPPVQLKDETGPVFQDRKANWFRECLRNLTFEHYGNISELRNGDVVCPGSKNQPHSDAIIVTELRRHNGSSAPGLIFDQIKFSSESADTEVKLSEITAGLDKLVRERGLLFDVPEDRRHGNQIAALGVKETDVIYCWSVLRKRPNTADLMHGIQKHANDVGFKGTILISGQDNQAREQFGDTFFGLALLHRPERD